MSGEYKELFTLYEDRWFTTQVKDTSRPCVTVWFSKGARNSGSISGFVGTCPAKNKEKN